MFACDITGKICQKSPPNRTGIPPNGNASLSQTSLKVRSTASRANLWVMGASSQTISHVFDNNFARPDCFVM